MPNRNHNSIDITGPEESISELRKYLCKDKDGKCSRCE